MANASIQQLMEMYQAAWKFKASWTILQVTDLFIVTFNYWMI